MNTEAEKRDYLAIIFMTTGSSHARGPDIGDCISRVGRIFVDDWSSLFDVAGREDVNVACYDVTGHDDLYWDMQGVHAHGPDGVVDIPHFDLRKITLPEKRRRR